jgi:hypothetical protein
MATGPGFVYIRSIVIVNEVQTYVISINVNQMDSIVTR